MNVEFNTKNYTIYYIVEKSTFLFSRCTFNEK